MTEPPGTHIISMTRRTRGERRAYLEGMKASLNFIRDGRTLEQIRESIKVCCEAMDQTEKGGGVEVVCTE